MSGPGTAAGEVPNRPSDGWRYRLRIPPLSVEGYRWASGLLTKPYARRPGWRRLAIILPCAVAVGVIAGLAINWTDASLAVGVSAARPSLAIWLAGLDAVLALLVLVFLTLLALRLLIGAWTARFIGRVHASYRMLNTENDLLLGDHGLEWRTQDGTLTVRWAGVAALVPDRGVHHLKLDGLNFLWLPDAALGEPRRREEILAYVAGRIAAAAPQPSAAP